MNENEIAALREKIKGMDKPLIIFICGMPGTRKSSTAVELATKLGFKIVLGTDQIRDIVKLYINNPILDGPTHNRWKLIGKRTEINIAAGYLNQSIALVKAVRAALEISRRGENVIFEGVHILPWLYKELKNEPDIHFLHFILLVNDEELHQRNVADKIGLRHGKEKEWPREKMEEIKIIQQFIIDTSPDHVYRIDSTTPEENAEKILKILEEVL